MQNKAWYLIGDPQIRERLAQIGSTCRFAFKCVVYAFAVIGVGNVALYVWRVFH